MLIDQIYEAAILPEKWPAVMQKIADRVGCKGLILSFVGKETRFIPSPGIEQIVNEYVTGGWTGNEARIDEMYREQYPGFLAETQRRAADVLYALPIYRDFLMPRGCFGACATPFQGVGDTAMHIAAEGFPSFNAAEDAVATLDRLRAHLGRALSLAAMAEQARADAFVAGLALAEVAAAVVQSDGRLRSANDLFVGRLGNDFFEAATGLRFENQFFQQCISDALQRVKSSERAQSIAVRSGLGNAPFVAHVIPISGHGRDIVGCDGVMIILAEAANSKIPNADILRLMFDLTPAQARLTRLVLEGRTIAEAAVKLGIKEITARVHLRSIFSKTGVKRQSELVGLLLGLGLRD